MCCYIPRINSFKIINLHCVKLCIMLHLVFGFLILKAKTLKIRSAVIYGTVYY